VLARPEALKTQLAYASARAQAQYSVTQMLEAIGLVIRKLQAGAAA
jgi:hypothetical protein